MDLCPLYVSRFTNDETNQNRNIIDCHILRETINTMYCVQHSDSSLVIRDENRCHEWAKTDCERSITLSTRVNGNIDNSDASRIRYASGHA